MNNPLKGEVGFDAGGKRWRMVFGPDAMATLEAHFEQSMAEMNGRMHSGIRMADALAFLWAALLRHHPDLTAQDVREIAEQAGVGLVIEKIATAWRGAFATEEEAPVPARPRRRAAAGTG